jgi:predicted O-linked N-acetylglucosamine transferase (SPINDLY family)
MFSSMPPLNSSQLTLFRHVEAITNLAATLMAMNKKKDAEQYWQRAVKLRPGKFDAVEHLIGLLCNENRNGDAIATIQYVERTLRIKSSRHLDPASEAASHGLYETPASEPSDKPLFDYEGDGDRMQDRRDIPGSDQPGFGSSGYAVPGTENGRIHTLVHARGNLLYAAGDTVGAAKAFEEAVLITVGRHFGTIDGLVRHILGILSREVGLSPNHSGADEPLLIPPTFALETLKLCFPPDGNLPGLRDLAPGGPSIKSAISTTSNSLLSLAKIFQDGMASSNPRPMPFKTNFGVREILALYYLSLSLQKSPSTANNVGILLAGLQQTTTPKMLQILALEHLPSIPGVIPGTGISLALAYYNFGLNQDRRHAHLFTNLGSLLKDLGQLSTAIKMYEEAVKCDQKFDIALANLANAVKDQGRIADAINYYQRAVDASPDFAEAVCGLANALNSVCGWQGRGGIADDNGSRDRWHVDPTGMLMDATKPGAISSGWIKRVVDLVDKQLAGGSQWGQGAIDQKFVSHILRCIAVTVRDRAELEERATSLTRALKSWSGSKWEGQRVVRLIERVIKRLTWQWYHDIYIAPRKLPTSSYERPALPQSLPVPAAPTVLPFHTFTSPMSARQIRQISQRNGLRISVSTLKAPWLPPIVSRPPAPPSPYLKVGYVSSDFNNHPLAHLMQSVFGLHNRDRVKAHCYATTASDNSIHRQQIEREAPVFQDASTWSADKLVNKIVDDGIHILVNLNGYTRGAKNEVFAARPAPIQMSFMGFAGTLGAEWCDYLLADETAVPPATLRPWRRNVDVEDLLEDDFESGKSDNWIYGENIIYCRDTFFCCDHRQSAPDCKEKNVSWENEQATRWKMRKEIFPDLGDDVIILGNFNQLYKIEPATFRTWLRILDRVPKAILWLLRFPDLGEQYLKKTAIEWSSPEVASRIMFTDVAPKQLHISRARVCDIFLDTPECNAHTTAADILWSGTPLLTLPRYKYKMCSRMAASILRGALPKGFEGVRAAGELIAHSDEDYEDKAVRLARDMRYEGHRPIGRLAELRKMLWQGRWSSALFNTRRWVRDLEEAYERAWDNWVQGNGGDIWLEDVKRE